MYSNLEEDNIESVLIFYFETLAFLQHYINVKLYKTICDAALPKLDMANLINHLGVLFHGVKYNAFKNFLKRNAVVFYKNAGPIER